MLLLIYETSVQDIESVLRQISMDDLRVLDFQSGMVIEVHLITLYRVTSHRREDDKHQVVFEYGVDDRGCLSGEGGQIEVLVVDPMGFIQTLFVVVVIIGIMVVIVPY